MYMFDSPGLYVSMGENNLGQPTSHFHGCSDSDVYQVKIGFRNFCAPAGGARTVQPEVGRQCTLLTPKSAKSDCSVISFIAKHTKNSLGSISGLFDRYDKL